MREEWFTRPVLLVADIERTLDFYVKRLGFAESWRYGSQGEGAVAQVERQGCTLIFSSQWPGRAGNGIAFVSLNVDSPPERQAAEASRTLDSLRAEFEGRRVDVQDGWWGYRLLMVRDPDGNELWFNYPNDEPPKAP